MRTRFHGQLLALADQRHWASRRCILDRTLFLLPPAPCVESCNSDRAYNRTAATCGKCFCLHTPGHGNSDIPCMTSQPNKVGQLANICTRDSTDHSLPSVAPWVESWRRRKVLSMQTCVDDEDDPTTPQDMHCFGFCFTSWWSQLSPLPCP